MICLCLASKSIGVTTDWVLDQAERRGVPRQLVDLKVESGLVRFSQNECIILLKGDTYDKQNNARCDQ